MNISIGDRHEGPEETDKGTRTWGEGGTYHCFRDVESVRFGGIGFIELSC